MRWLCILLASGALAQTPRDGMQAAIEKQRAAAAIQREAVRKQAESAAPWPLAAPDAEPIAETSCEPVTDTVAAPIIEGAARAQNVQPKLLRAVIEQESGFRPCAVSVKGAQGLMQLMPDTARQFGVHDPFDPKENVEAGARFLKQLIDRYKGDLSLALGAYNAGPATVDQAGKIPDIPETRDYVDAVLKKMATPIAPPQSPTPRPIEN